MSKKVVVISTSLRGNSNSELLAKSFAKGAEDAGNTAHTREKSVSRQRMS